MDATNADKPARFSRQVSEQHRLQPNSRNCFGCGLENTNGLRMRFYSTSSGSVESSCRVDRRFEGYPGVVHGGVVASMLDELVGRVSMGDDPNRFLVTAKLEVRYRKPVPTEQELFLHGERISERGRRTRAKAEMRLADGQLVAEAEATLIDYPGELGDPELLESLGWRVVPEGT